MDDLVKPKPTWHNTLNNDGRNFWHIQEFAEQAYGLGYPYICWNDRIYEIVSEDRMFSWQETEYTISDLS